MDRRILIGGVALSALILTLVLSSRHGAAAPADVAPVATAPALAPEAAPTAIAESAPRDDAPSAAPVPAPPEPTQSAPQSEPDSASDTEREQPRTRGDRGGGRGARTR